MTDNSPAEALGSDNGSLDTVGSGLIGVALLIGIAELFYKPFLLTPIALVVMLTGILMTGKNKRLSQLTAVVVAVCFIAGAAAAVWSSRALY